ncbi:MAG: penicillin-binding protein 2 [Candidatus Aminicenantaceae bacterium]
MKNGIYEDISLILRRARLSFLVVGATLLLLVLYLWKMQILDYKKYWEMSEANRIREVILPAQRGLIKDRSENVLATNIAAFQAAVVREESQNLEESYRRIAGLLEMDAEVIRERVDKYRSFAWFHPIVIKDDLDDEEVAKIESRRKEFPELMVQTEPKRSYPKATFAAHVLGYLQEISPEEIRQGTFGGRGLGDLIGRTGIEREYDSELVGASGRDLEIVESTGRYKETVLREDPVDGHVIQLTLDSRLQAKAEEILEGREGAVVVMDTRSGQLLALASFPTFDPNKFINRFTPEEWMDLINNPSHPLENRALRGLYAPGSIFKLVMALAALETNLVTERTSFYCSGSILIYNHPFNCWFAGGHGEMDLANAIRNSCNIYFYQIGKQLGIETIAEYARKLGLGERTAIDLKGEYAGLVPDRDWKRRVRNAPWYPGETISVSIGQGPLLVTPLQIATMTATLANRGKRVQPHLLLEEGEGSTIQDLTGIGVSSANIEKIIQGMWMSANEGGTSRAAGVAGMDVCGKTGSTQVVSRQTAERLGESRRETRTHSWFSGFAPRNDPRVAVTVIVEFGGMGGSTAAPVARELFRLYWELLNHD